VVKGESMRSLFAAVIALMVVGCAGSPWFSAPPQQQVVTNLSTGPVAGLCRSPDTPPADVTNKPGYRQFDVSVTNASGQPIVGLTKQDFVVLENSQSVPVAYFREHKNDEQVAIALVVDTSGSMEPKLPIVKQYLGNFVTNLNRCDEVVLFAFSGSPFLLMPLSTDHQKVAREMKLFHAYGQTALYDATNAALQSLQGADYPKRKIILITDGMDNVSSARRRDVLVEASKDGVTIYVVGIGEPNAQRPAVSSGPYFLGVDAKTLENLSAVTGGRSFIVPATGGSAAKEFQNAIASIAEAIGAGYAIGAEIPDGVILSTVNVAVAKRPDAVVRARLITEAR
jgi:VWFA-related protein